jgi:hypothetical protein
VAAKRTSFALYSRGARLDKSTLVLGRTSKDDCAGAIGQFGEGYKLALVVLAREGRPVVISNANVEWVPEFRTSRQFGIETLHIVERDLPREIAQDGLTFTIDGLTEEDHAGIAESCLMLQEPMKDAIHAREGRILPSRPGKLYVGGLFVCSTELDYGYDIKPGFIELERDRKTVEGFNLRWLTKNMWVSLPDQLDQLDHVAEMIERESKDVASVQFGAPEIVEEACYRLFVSKNPGGVVVKTQEELNAAVANGLTNTVYVGGSFHSMVSGSKSYQSVRPTERAMTPSEELRHWYDANKKYMSRMPLASFKSILTKSEKWRLM